ncbi:MAG: undecaprenyl-diphosphatase UppP [Anaerolineales bacterium]|nr:MAG: undecaprenyl-diphosphatase UppP [Anaerolineales bacterium]
MSLFQALFLGIIQGATEFLPISSSGHLVLAPWLLGWHFDPRQAFIFDVLVQWGTILAVILYFRQDLLQLMVAGLRSLRNGTAWKDPDARLAWAIVLASIPAAVLGLLLKSLVENTFGSSLAVSAFLMGTALILILSERLSKLDRTMESLSWLDALWIGAFQALALFPGISRSGATIAGGLLRGFQREQAARFSFILAVPTMLGAGVIALRDLGQAGDVTAQLAPLAVGFLAAAIVGFFAIHWFLSFLRQQRLYGFAVYCAMVSLGSFLVYGLRL